jgi:hypothetical protein
MKKLSLIPQRIPSSTVAGILKALPSEVRKKAATICGVSEERMNDITAYPQLFHDLLHVEADPQDYILNKFEDEYRKPESHTSLS